MLLPSLGASNGVFICCFVALSFLSFEKFC